MAQAKQVTRMEDYERWQLDIGRTLVANMAYFIFASIVLIFIVFAFGYADKINDETLQVVYLIVIAFSIVKLGSWMGGVTLEYKEREINK